MKLKDVDLFTWVLYDGQPYNIKEKSDNYSRLKHSNGKIVRISIDKDVDVLDVPTFKVGEKVMCIDNKSPFNGQLVTIKDDDNSSFAPYEYDDYLWATPFDLVKIDY